jgi:Protein of unknown function (DUF3800)
MYFLLTLWKEPTMPRLKMLQKPFQARHALVVPILPITRQRPSRITRRDRSPQLLQIGFEKLVGDDQRLDRLTCISRCTPRLPDRQPPLAGRRPIVGWALKICEKPFGGWYGRGRVSREGQLTLGLRVWRRPPFEAKRIVRLVYLDEAGVSNPAHEPILVVAGVIVNPDRQWKELEAYFRNLAHSLFPEDDPYRFVFHAKDIFHGSGAFDRQRWSRKERIKILSQLAQVPRLFDLPIVLGDMNRADTQRELQKVSPRMSAKSMHNFTHTNAFINAIQRVQFWMEKHAPEESAMLIAEDTPELKATLKNVHECYTDATLDNEDTFRAPNIIDAVHFAQKSESLLLQIADHCAFVIKRELMGKHDVDDCYSVIEPYIQRDLKPVSGFAYRVREEGVELITDKDEIERLKGLGY